MSTVSWFTQCDRSSVGVRFGSGLLEDHGDRWIGYDIDWSVRTIEAHFGFWWFEARIREYGWWIRSVKFEWCKSDQQLHEMIPCCRCLNDVRILKEPSEDGFLGYCRKCNIAVLRPLPRGAEEWVARAHRNYLDRGEVFYLTKDMQCQRASSIT